jgi:hypothetical protein
MAEEERNLRHRLEPLLLQRLRERERGEEGEYSDPIQKLHI